VDAERKDIPATYDSLVGIVRSSFNVKDEILREDGSLEFEISETQNLKVDFKKIIMKLRPYGYLAILRKVDDTLLLKVGEFKRVKKKTSITPFLLLAATIGTISIDGLFRTPNLPNINFSTTIILYVLAVLGIIGMHELSHKIAVAKHGMNASMPYFIPGFPTILPTFGAFISTRDPPVNKDSLFDLGLSGPIAGLVITILVGIGGAFTAFGVPIEVAEESGAGPVTIDFFTETILSLFTNIPDGYVIILSPLTFAATLGFLITFLNLMPAWQLDGGHIAAAILTNKQHRIATYLSIIILFVLGFSLMALFVLVLSLQTPEARPLDDVSQLSPSRRWIFLGVIIVAVSIYFFTIVNNPFFMLGF